MEACGNLDRAILERSYGRKCTSHHLSAAHDVLSASAGRPVKDQGRADQGSPIVLPGRDVVQRSVRVQAGENMIASNGATSKLTQFVLVGAAVIAVAVADVLLKKATLNGSVEHAVRSPWLWGAVGLYLLQVGFFTYAFVSGWRLSHIGALQAALYALVVLGAGVWLYRETLTPVQIVGMVLAVGGVVLMNWP
jgi:multidrug transporter EmrE-like cation transporter